jgi:hypothetical protein
VKVSRQVAAREGSGVVGGVSVVAFIRLSVSLILRDGGFAASSG